VTDGDDRLGIQSVEVAADILRAMIEGGGLLQLRDLSRLSEMPRGKVHRYLTSMTRSGILYQDSDSGAYGIGPLAITLGLTGLRRMDPIRIAYAQIPELSADLRESVIVAIWGDMGPTVVALQESPLPVTLNVRAGSVLPLRTSATGTIFEAYLPAPMIDAVAARMGLPTVEQEGEVFAQRLEEIRHHGLSRTVGAVLPGINAMAAPIFDHTGKMCLAVGLVGRQESLDIAWEGVPARKLKAFARGISQSLGAPAAAFQD